MLEYKILIQLFVVELRVDMPLSYLLVSCAEFEYQMREGENIASKTKIYSDSVHTPSFVSTQDACFQLSRCIRSINAKILHTVPRSRSWRWVSRQWPVSVTVINVCFSICLILPILPIRLTKPGQARRSIGSLQQSDLYLCCAHSLLSERRRSTGAVSAVQTVLPAVDSSQHGQIQSVAKIRLVSYFCPRGRVSSTFY